ncbi:hypothetical protein [Tardiphaga sp. 862_B3_N1_1]|uniref:hypothetical protein n=1 Tax=Tardiphaga sp. 862_B3_N1_1 TaxID=3240763 RepID=UPI003F8AF342
MLQQSTNPPQMIGPHGFYTQTPEKAVDASIQPLEPEASNALAVEIDHLLATGDVQGMVAMYDAYMAAAGAIHHIKEMPRASGCDALLDYEWERLISKAYLVADRLQEMRPSKHDVNAMGRALFECALEMGNNLPEAMAVVQAIDLSKEGAR